MTMPPEPPADDMTPEPGPGRDAGAAPTGRFVAAPVRPAAPEVADRPSPGGGSSRPSPLSAWARLLAVAGLVLALLQLVEVAGSVAEGLAVPSGGPQGLAGDVWQRIGYAFLTNITVANSLVLVVAVLMAAAPALVRASGEPRSGRLAAELTAIVAAVSAAGLALGSVLAVRTRLHQFALLHQAVPSYQRRALLTFVAGSVGGCLIAFALALGLPRRGSAAGWQPGESGPQPD